MTLLDEDVEVRRPDLLLTWTAARIPLDRPRTLLALLEGRRRAQRYVGVTEVWQDPPEDDLDRSRLVEQALERLGLERSGPHCTERWSQVVGIVVRPGPVWFGDDEAELLWGLRYGRNLVSVLHGEVLTVTPAGWLTWPDEAHGRSPRARWS